MKIVRAVVLFAVSLAVPSARAHSDRHHCRHRDRRSHREANQRCDGLPSKVCRIVAETDANGRFSLMAPRGRQTIAASVIGYALLRTDIEVADAPLDMTIRLSEGAGAYTERVSVSGSLRRESDSVAGGTSLYGRELETLRGAVLDDPLRAVQSLPSATATDDFYSEFAVRGNPFRYVGLVVDGVPIAVSDARRQRHHRRRLDRDDQQRDAGQCVPAPGQLSAAHGPPDGRRGWPGDPRRQPRRVPRTRRPERHERDLSR